MRSGDQSPEVGREASLDESKEGVWPQSDGGKKTREERKVEWIAEREKGRADERRREGRLVEIGDSARNSDVTWAGPVPKLKNI